MDPVLHATITIICCVPNPGPVRAIFPYSFNLFWYDSPLLFFLFPDICPLDLSRCIAVRGSKRILLIYLPYLQCVSIFYYASDKKGLIWLFPLPLFFFSSSNISLPKCMIYGRTQWLMPTTYCPRRFTLVFTIFWRKGPAYCLCIRLEVHIGLHCTRFVLGLAFCSFSIPCPWTNVDRKRFVYLLLSFTNLAQDTDIFRLETYLIIKVPFIFGQCATWGWHWSSQLKLVNYSGLCIIVRSTIIELNRWLLSPVIIPKLRRSAPNLLASIFHFIPHWRGIYTIF